METKLLKDLCFPNKCGVYGIPASAEEYNISKTRYLRISDISEDGLLINTDKKSVSDSQIDKYILKEGDIVFARTGNSTGKSYYHEAKNGELAFAGFLIKFSLDPSKVNPKYLRYFTISNDYREWVKNFSLGSTRGNLNANSFGNCPIPLPSRKRQDFLVKVLSDLDAKIEVNNQINAKLEAMAKTLYEYWFVQFDFPSPPTPEGGAKQGKPYKSSGGKMVYNEELKREIPEGWEVYKFSQLGEFKNGVNYDPSNPGNIACPIINVRNISASSFFIKNHDLDKVFLNHSDIKKYSVNKKSIIIARSGIPGATRLISDMEKNTLYCGFAIHFDINKAYNKLPIFFYLKSIEKAINSGSGGTIMKNVNQATLKSQKICLPENEYVIKEFDKKLKPIFGKINLIQKENQKLTELRDWLLPMLMNGQVRVGEVEEYVRGEGELGMVAERGEVYKHE
ncbi:MAG: restriction endonuclease subunit S [Flavobacteriaceae bacterium]|nr:restriction endonuclease subunit S [Flavobacteriaceae bacterium]